METRQVPGKDSSEGPDPDWTSPQRPRAWGRQLSEGKALHQPHALALSLVQLEDNSLDEHLRQSLPYLQSPQEPLRLEAVTFIGEPEPRGPSVPEGRRRRWPGQQGQRGGDGEMCCWEGLVGRVCDRLCVLPRAHCTASEGLA